MVYFANHFANYQHADSHYLNCDGCLLLGSSVMMSAVLFRLGKMANSLSIDCNYHVSNLDWMHDGPTYDDEHCKMMPPLNQCPKCHSVRRQAVLVQHSKIGYSDDVKCDVTDNLDTKPMLMSDAVDSIHAFEDTQTDTAMTLSFSISIRFVFV